MCAFATECKYELLYEGYIIRQSVTFLTVTYPFYKSDTQVMSLRFLMVDAPVSLHEEIQTIQI